MKHSEVNGVTDGFLDPTEAPSCGCLARPHDYLVHHADFGMDEHFAEVSLLVCSECGQHWLRYHLEDEAFSGSGRWYLGAITAEQAAIVTAATARATLEALPWYWYGGSYFEGRVGKGSGAIV
jgi:hypothetical protein